MTWGRRATSTNIDKVAEEGIRDAEAPQEVAAAGQDDAASGERDPEAWWKSCKPRINAFISRIPTKSEYEASPMVLIHKNTNTRTVEIITSSATYTKRLRKSIPELEALGPEREGYRVVIKENTAFKLS